MIAASHSGLVVAINISSSAKENNLSKNIIHSPELLWSAHLSNRIESSPIANFEGTIIYVCDYSGLFYALETMTGRIVWQQSTGEVIKCTPTLFNGTCLVDKLVITGSYDHHLYCWNQYSGELRWKINPASSAIFASVAVIVDNYDIVDNNNKIQIEPRLLCATLNGTITNVGLSSGHIYWRRVISPGPIFSSPIIHNTTTSCGSAIIGLTHTNIIMAISLSDGTSLWTTPVDGPIFSSPSTFISSIFPEQCMAIYSTHNCYSVICINLNTGKLVWKFTTKSVVYSSCFFIHHHDPSTLVAIVVESDSTLHLLDVTTGKPISLHSKLFEKDSTSHYKIIHTDQYRLQTNGAKVFSSPIYHRGKLFIGSRDSCLHCFSFND